MESLLSLSFDYLSSADGGKTRKGLRQLEGLLAQICLSKSGGVSKAQKRKSTATATPKDSTPKELSQLKDDAAFREFFKLQEGFEWNVSIRLISCLERLLGRGSTGANDLLIVSTLDLLHGMLLIHPPSRSLFAREIYMNLLLDLLDPTSCPAIQASTLLTLVSALLNAPQNTRTFELLDGLLTVTSLFKSRGISRDVKMKSVEFLYFYLMPETPSSAFNNGAAAYYGSGALWGVGPRNSSRSTDDDNDDDDEDSTRSSEEKQHMLGKYLSNVEDFVEDLRGGSFGGNMF